jgi:hypothetical protein
MFKDSDGNYKLKIAFDYDDTLTDSLLFKLAERLIKRGHDVWVMTARSSDEQYMDLCKSMNINPSSETERNSDLLETVRQLGIENKVIYTNCEDKKVFFQQHHFDLLFDDDAEWHCNPICEAGGMAVNI